MYTVFFQKFFPSDFWVLCHGECVECSTPKKDRKKESVGVSEGEDSEASKLYTVTARAGQDIHVIYINVFEYIHMLPEPFCPYFFQKKNLRFMLVNAC